VLVAAPAHAHGPASFGGSGITSAAGWPDSIWVMSGSGPFGPIFSGVWQSWQPLVATRYSPRFAGSADVGAGAGAAVPATWSGFPAWPPPQADSPTVAATRPTASATRALVMGAPVK